ncbi:hypothetical protein G7054_g14849 [Neopestalotiopsis clavispora]|nr:hypothetical protein G7054_g14849 [Neopestalotiopsis clavispora]
MHAPVALVPVLGDAAGRLRTALAPLVFRLGADDSKQRAPITTSRITRVSIVVTPSNNNGGGGGGGGSMYSGVATPKSTTLRLRLETGRGPNKQFIAATGEGDFKELGSAGLRTPEFDLDPNITRRGVWIVVEQIGGGAQGSGGSLQVEILSEGIVNVGGWETIDD